MSLRKVHILLIKIFCIQFVYNTVLIDIQYIVNDDEEFFLPCSTNNTYKFPSKTDCKMYINCINGKGLIFNCADDEVFSVRQQICVKNKTICVDDNRNTNIYSFAKTTIKPMITNRAEFDYEESGEMPNDNIIKCNKTVNKNGNFSVIAIQKHPTNCKLFLNCVTETWFYIQECASGTVFNERIGNCDFSYNVPTCKN